MAVSSHTIKGHMVFQRFLSFFNNAGNNCSSENGPHMPKICYLFEFVWIAAGSESLENYFQKRCTFGSKSGTKSLVLWYMAKFSKNVPEHFKRDNWIMRIKNITKHKFVCFIL